jgi:hypothetical protein
VLTVKQAAERAGVSESLVYAWCDSDLLPHARLPGARPTARGRGLIRISEADLAAFLLRYKRGGKAEEAPEKTRGAPADFAGYYERVMAEVQAKQAKRPR